MPERYVQIWNSKSKLNENEKTLLRTLPGEVLDVSGGESFLETLNTYFFDKENPKSLQDYSLLVSGGDGTVNSILEFAQSTKMDVAIIPRGTGNDTAKSVGLTDYSLSDYVEVLKNPDKQKTSEIDVLKLQVITLNHNAPLTKNSEEIKYATAAVSLGLIADAANVGDTTKKIFGSFAYKLKGLGSILFKSTPHANFIWSDEGEIKGSYSGKPYAILLLNTPTAGGGSVGYDGAKIDDKKFDLLYVTKDGIDEKKARRYSLIKLIPALVDLSSEPASTYHVGEADKFQIESTEGIALNYDGESGGIANEVNISYAKNPLKVIVPRQAL